jgi:hypothetical protein
VAKKDMREMTQTTSPGKDYQAEYDQLLDQLLDTAPQVGKALVRAHKNRTKELNRYLNQDTLRKHFPGSYFAGLEEVYSVLDATREAYEQSETLKDIACVPCMRSCSGVKVSCPGIRGAEGQGKRKGVLVRGRLKEAWNERAGRGTRTGYEVWSRRDERARDRAVLHPQRAVLYTSGVYAQTV